MTVTIYQAKTHLSHLLHHVEQGEEVIVCRGKQPVAKIVPTSTLQSRRPKLGRLTSPRFAIPHEAFLPLGADELKEWGICRRRSPRKVDDLPAKGEHQAQGQLTL